MIMTLDRQGPYQKSLLGRGSAGAAVKEVDEHVDWQVFFSFIRHSNENNLRGCCGIGRGWVSA